jgi:hypothetical protein
MNERHDEIDDAVAVEGRLYLLTAEEGSTTQERLGSPGADRGPLIRRVGGTESGAALASRRARYGPDSSSRLNCRIAARQISGEASLITTAILEILSEFLRAIMHGHVALREYAIHFPARKIGELCGLAQTENALRIKRNGKFRSQPLDLFQIRQAKRIGYIARNFKSQGLRHSHHRSGGQDPMQALSRAAARRRVPARQGSAGAVEFMHET